MKHSERDISQCILAFYGFCFMSLSNSKLFSAFYLTVLSFFSHRPRVLNKDDKIYNIKGTSRFTSPNGTWKEFWKKDSGRRQWPKKCPVAGCANDARVGAHIGVNQNQKQYILPMCDKCNLTRHGLMKPNSNSAAVPILKRDK